MNRFTDIETTLTNEHGTWVASFTLNDYYTGKAAFTVELAAKEEKEAQDEAASIKERLGFPDDEEAPLNASEFKSVQKFIGSHIGTKMGVAFLLALTGGISAEEAAALRWRDINFTECLIYVNEEVQQDYSLSPAQDARTVYLEPGVMVDLEEYFKDRAETCKEYGVTLSPEHFILGDVSGGYITPLLIWGAWYPLARVANITRNPQQPYDHEYNRLKSYEAVTNTAVCVEDMEGIDPELSYFLQFAALGSEHEN